MIALLQRVNHASVTVDEQVIGQIGKGLLIFVGVEKNDSEKNAADLFQKILKFRIFSDENDRLNHNILQAGGEILLVPQFTLPAETKKGNRPGFDPVASPEKGKALFEYLHQQFLNSPVPVATGQFQAHMLVNLENDGPLTFWLQK